MPLSEQALQSIKNEVNSEKFLSSKARTYLNSTDGLTQKKLAGAGLFRVESDQDALVVIDSFLREVNRCFQQSSWHMKIDPAERALIKNIFQAMKVYKNLVSNRIEKNTKSTTDSVEERITDKECLAGDWQPGSALDQRQDKLMIEIRDEMK